MVPNRGFFCCHIRLVDELAEAHKKERQWIEKEKEYKILLDVLQSSSKDSRELTEVRTAERTAAGALAAAEGDLASARAALQALQSESEKGASADGANADDADVEGELNKKVANLEMKLKLQKEVGCAAAAIGNFRVESCEVMFLCRRKKDW